MGINTRNAKFQDLPDCRLSEPKITVLARTSSNLAASQSGQEGVDWVHLAQDRDLWRALVSTVENFQVAQNAASLISMLATISNSRISSPSWG
jgi:hypothetical protein